LRLAPTRRDEPVLDARFDIDNGCAVTDTAWVYLTVGTTCKPVALALRLGSGNQDHP
jgi:hypothetical protein